MERLISQEQLLEYHPKTSLTVISSGRVANIGFNELVHIRKFGCEVVIYTENKEYRTRYSLQDILNDLPVLIVSRLKENLSHFSAETLSQQGF